MAELDAKGLEAAYAAVDALPLRDMEHVGGELDRLRSHEGARAAVRAYLAASPLAQEQGWQPIATAPKDETEVLLFCPSLDAPYWMALSQDSNHFPADSGRVVGRYYDGAWVSHAGESGWEDSVTPICLMPTHWRPLPAAPTPGGEE